MKKATISLSILLFVVMLVNILGTTVFAVDTAQVIYLWDEENIPTTTVYTENNSNYFDPPDFQPNMVYTPAKQGVDVKGAVLICPGGAFQFRGDNDGAPVAAELSELGYHSFVVNYRLQPFTMQEGALDLARAVRFVRSHAEEYGIDKDDIAVIGFSAGGILCGELALNFDGLVNGTALDASYIPDKLDEVSADVGAVGMIYSFYGKLSVASTDVEKFRSSDLPPTYFLYGSEEVFRSQIEACADAVKQAGVSVESQILDGLQHGFGARGSWFEGFDTWLTTAFASDSGGGEARAGDNTNSGNDTTNNSTPFFNDVSPDVWYADAVSYVQENGLMSGTSETTFAPNTTMSRAMLATVLWRLDGSPTVQRNLSFADVPIDTWYTEAVRWAVQNDIVSGYSDQTFGSNDPVTREQIATLMYRYEQYKNDSASIGQPLGFTDAESVSPWATEAVAWANAMDVMNGKTGNVFDPGSGATRAEVAMVLMNYLSMGSNQAPKPETPERADNKALVVYFSMPETTDLNNMTQEEENSTVVINGEVLGNTQYVAYIIQEQTGADIFRIEPEIPYPTNHSTLVDLAADEQEQNARPQLSATVENVEQYDTIFIGYPNWWGDMPMILYTFLEEYDLSGKTIIPFNTHGGSGFSDTVQTIASMQPNATVITDGFTVSRNNVHEVESDVISWLAELGFTK